MQYLTELHHTVATKTDDFLKSFFKKSIDSSDKISPSYGRLWRNIETVVMAGGKRVRPYLTAVGYGGLNDEKRMDKIIPAAAAQELLHCGLLMHDDIIDRDYIRRGKDNLAGMYKHAYSSLNEPDKTHFADSAAMLGGDLLIASAHEVIRRSDFNADDKITALGKLHSSIFDVAAGELMDFEASFLRQDSHSFIKIASYKTASYSFIGPLVTGASLAGEPEEVLSSLSNFALNLGIAFQLQDDLLGIFGDESVTGKSNISDLIEAKHTYLIEQYKSSSRFDNNLFKKVFGNPGADEEKISSLKQAIEASGARSQAESAVEKFTSKALMSLKPIDQTHYLKEELELFCKSIIYRKS